MKILIDLSPLKAGGGCQLALNFVKQLNEQSDKHKYLILLPDVGPLQVLTQDISGISFIISPSSSVFKRFFFEMITLRYIYKKYSVQKIFTFMGSGLPHPPSIKSIIGVCYPIICYDDSVYWSYLRFFERKKQKIKNWFRKSRIATADKIIVETDIMKIRLEKVIHNSKHKLVVLPPAVSDFINENIEIQKNSFNILILSGNGKHKNLWRLKDVFIELLSYNFEFKFIITLNTNDIFLESEVDTLNVPKYFDFVGVTHPYAVDNLYKISDVLLNMSDLESFSNNYMEAWKAGIPLIVSERDFAKHICKDSAIYIEPHQPKEIASVLYGLYQNRYDKKKYIIEGKKNLSRLPTNKERFNELIKIISNV